MIYTNTYHSDGGIYRLDMVPNTGPTPITTLATDNQLRSKAIVRVFQSSPCHSILTSNRRDMCLDNDGRWTERPICVEPGSWTPEELRPKVFDYQRFEQVTLQIISKIFFFFRKQWTIVWAILFTTAFH